MMFSYLTHLLRKAGIDHIYGSSEEALTEIARAVSMTSGMTWIELRTDEAAACAATEEAEATGLLAVCAGSYGAGKADLIRGLEEAHQSGAPVLAVASHAGPEAGRHGQVREIHPERLFAGCSSYCGVVDDPSHMSRLARAAMQHALVRSDVAVLLLDAFAGVHSPEARDSPISPHGCVQAIGGWAPRVRRPGLRRELCAVRRHGGSR
jgi:pyruvate dehydrogenase (quinone)